MGKPRMIIVIRHAQSEGNINWLSQFTNIPRYLENREIHQTIPDHRVKLTSEGWSQAYDAGRSLRKLLRADDNLHFFISPYRRTRETTEGILSTLTSDEPFPTPFPRNSIKVYEEPRLREQDFGNFQPCSAEMERMWQERADYGHFFYRIPNGESAADVYDRISGFNESLWRQFNDDDFASVCILVTHGLMSRIFLMKWYHFSVEYFEDLRNVNHCEFLIMRKSEDSGKYILENRLRTWSELKFQQIAVTKDAASKDEATDTSAMTTWENGRKSESGNSGNDETKVIQAPFLRKPFRRKWGGCPNGCDHGKLFKKDKSTDIIQGNRHPSSFCSQPTAMTPCLPRGQIPSSDEKVHDSHSHLAIEVEGSLDDGDSSPDGTPSFISIESRLKYGPIPSHEENSQALKKHKYSLGFDVTSRNSSQAGSDDCNFSAEEDIKRGRDSVFQRNGSSGMASSQRKDFSKIYQSPNTPRPNLHESDYGSESEDYQT